MAAQIAPGSTITPRQGVRQGNEEGRGKKKLPVKITGSFEPRRVCAWSWPTAGVFLMITVVDNGCEWASAGVLCGGDGERTLPRGGYRLTIVDIGCHEYQPLTPAQPCGPGLSSPTRHTRAASLGHGCTAGRARARRSP